MGTNSVGVQSSELFADNWCAGQAFVWDPDLEKLDVKEPDGLWIGGM